MCVCVCVCVCMCVCVFNRLQTKCEARQCLSFCSQGRSLYDVTSCLAACSNIPSRIVSVSGPMFLPGGSLPRGSMPGRVSVQGGVSLGGSLSREVSVKGCLCPGVSLSRGVSVQGCLCPGGSVQGSLSRGGLFMGDPHNRDLPSIMLLSERYASYWNSFLFTLLLAHEFNSPKIMKATFCRYMLGGKETVNKIFFVIFLLSKMWN